MNEYSLFIHFRMNVVFRINRNNCQGTGTRNILTYLTLNIPSLGRQRCLPSWGPRKTPGFFVISQLFDAVDYSNYVFLGF